MARNAVQSATALPDSPEDDRKKRMRKYSIAMSVRTICLILVFVVPDWWKLVFGLGAMVLPYVAVVLANVGDAGATRPVNPTALPQLAIEQQRR